MQVLHTVDVDEWAGAIPADVREAARDALEGGMVLFLPRLAFSLTEDERRLLERDLPAQVAKNISLDPATGAIGGLAAAGEPGVLLQGMLDRFAQAATGFVRDLLPDYAGGLERARTSFRPVEVQGRRTSPRKDDRRLHVDAFPSRPTGGRRILRFFSNINPAGEARVWQVGEPFEAFCAKFAGKVRRPIALKAWLLAKLGVTKGQRSAYDHFMLGLHDRAKLDEGYQRAAPRVELAFPPGSSWICYTDQVLHAALAGRFALEQTFHVPVASMAHPAQTPLRVLERLTGRALT